MIRWKALLAGCTLIVVLGLLVQLAFIFVVVAYNGLADRWPSLEPLGRPLAYASGTLVYFAIMASAGYLTAHLARRRVLLHASLVGSLVTGASLLSSLGAGKLTPMSLAFFVSGIVFTLAGAFAWQRHGR